MKTKRITVWCCWFAKQEKPPWPSIVLMATIFGLLTFAFVMMEGDMNAAFSKLQHRIDHGSWVQTINRRWHGPDLASALVGVLFFSGLWLLPVVIVSRYAPDARRALLCLTAIGMWASLIVLVAAIGALTVVYFTTNQVENALSWSSPRTACIAACALVFCSVFFLFCRGHTQQLHRTYNQSVENEQNQ